MSLRAKSLPTHRVIVETAYDWSRGIAVAMVLAVLAGVMDSLDDVARARDAQIAALAQANERLAQERKTAEATTRVELVPGEPDGFGCKQFHIRPNWTKAVAGKCEELGRLLLDARTIP